MAVGTSGTFAKAYSDYISFYSKIADAFADSYAAMVDIYLQERGSTSAVELERKTMAKARANGTITYQVVNSAAR
ncbi:MAG TPA: hypothetical protein VE544_10970 [Nitrososphaeraceae archaeon]|jgi:hypothetical protein|nr:hypothetical protein [Nitrososphaeraceae archaeon]